MLVTRSQLLAKRLKAELNLLIQSRLQRKEFGEYAIVSDDPRRTENWDGLNKDTTQQLLSLQNKDFPLVCTFDHFLRLLENTVKYIMQFHHCRILVVY